MREIKFRIWDINARKWLKSFNIDLLDIPKFNLAEVNQYTGLKDMREKEIYEGDILLSSNENGIFLISINFGDSNIEDSNILTCFQIKIEKTLAGSQYLEYFNNNLIKLINKYNIPIEEYNNEKYISDGWWILGNIYQNPELIKEVR
jgi:hypothetical protein fuD12_02509